VARYTGQEERSERERIAQSPPDMLLTNFMMLELILTRFEPIDRRVVENCRGLEFLVLDELHTYRGRQGADVAMLVRRLRQRLSAEKLLCIGTSATMSTTGTIEDQNKTVAEAGPWPPLLGKSVRRTRPRSCPAPTLVSRAASGRLATGLARPRSRACRAWHARA